MAGEKPTPIFRSEGDLARLPASDRIRYRLVGAGCRYHANDNIAEFIEDGELDELRAEVEEQMQGVLRALVIDTESDHNTNDTAKRVAKMFLTEVFKGRYVGAARGHRVPERLAPQRADDRRPGQGAKRVLASPVPDPRQGLDRPACPTSTRT